MGTRYKEIATGKYPFYSRTKTVQFSELFQP